MRKKKIFIGCSTKELPLAERIKTLLEPEFEVVPWNIPTWENGELNFKLNDNLLQKLLRATLQFDFAIILGTKDDKVEFKGQTVLQARDNVLFELGLFIGRMGLSNCAFVVEEGLKKMSDLNGIIINRFNNEKKETFDNAIQQTAQAFKQFNEANVNFFPSATLAAVYFENLVLPTCKSLIENNGILVSNKKYRSSLLKIVVPHNLSTNLNLQFEKYKNNHATTEVDIQSSGRIRKLHLEVDIKNDRPVIIDFPTVLAGINHSIKNLLPNEFNSMDNDYQEILNREIERFITSVKLFAIREDIDELLEFERI